MILPVRDLIYLTPIFDRKRSRGGIIVPDIAQDRCDQGIVKYVGPDVIDLKVGDYCLFPNYTGTIMHVEDEGHIIIMPEPSITAVLEGKPQETSVPGLYFKDEDGELWTATYEMIFTLVADACESADWYKAIRDARRRK